MVVLGEEIAGQSGVGQPHAQSARLDQAIPGGDIPANDLSILRRARYHGDAISDRKWRF